MKKLESKEYIHPLQTILDQRFGISLRERELLKQRRVPRSLRLDPLYQYNWGDIAIWILIAIVISAVKIIFTDDLSYLGIVWLITLVCGSVHVILCNNYPPRVTILEGLATCRREWHFIAHGNRYILVCSLRVLNHEFYVPYLGNYVIEGPVRIFLVRSTESIIGKWKTVVAIELLNGSFLKHALPRKPPPQEPGQYVGIDAD